MTKNTVILSINELIKYLKKLKHRLQKMKVFSTLVEVEMIKQRVLNVFVLLFEKEKKDKLRGKSIDKMNKEQFSKYINNEITLK